MQKQRRGNSSIILKRAFIGLGAIFFAFSVIILGEYKVPQDALIQSTPVNIEGTIPREDSATSAPTPILPSGWTSTPRKVDPAQARLPRISSTESINPYRKLLEVPPNVRADDGSTFSIDKDQYRVTEIHAVPLRMVCTNPDGKRW